MMRSENMAFLAVLLHVCGIHLTYELVLIQPPLRDEPFIAVLVHLTGLALTAAILPIVVRRGRQWHVIIVGWIVAAAAIRLTGPDIWATNYAVRLLVHFGHGILSASSLWFFFKVTAQDNWVWRYVLACSAGLALKACVMGLAAMGEAARLPGLYLLVGLLYGMLALITAWGIMHVSAASAPILEKPGKGNRPFWTLAANTLLVGMLLALLSGRLGPHPRLWVGTQVSSHAILAPLILVLVGWCLSKDFTAGFRRLMVCCCIICLALVALAVMRHNQMATQSHSVLSVCCHTAFFAGMTLALVQVGATSPLFSLSTVLAHGAMMTTGAMTFLKVPTEDFGFSFLVAVCLVIIMVLKVSVARMRFAPDGILFSCGRTEELSFEQAMELYAFSPRERDIAECLWQGKSVHDIMQTLYISRHTVNTHVRNMCEKTRCKTRRDLVRLLAAYKR